MMSERLIDLVAKSRTPADALRAVRDWLEEHGAPTAAMAVHREVTDIAQDWRGITWDKASFDEGYERGEQAAISKYGRSIKTSAVTV
jgi:hypothetical protein